MANVDTDQGLEEIVHRQTNNNSLENKLSDQGLEFQEEAKMSAQERNWSFVINLGNSIIGVSVLAMPFCFKKCGILLGPLLLLCSSWLTQVSCGLLMKSATTSKRRSYEFLAYHAFGAMGKLTVEISIIGLLVGTCIAFHVIIGDLGPAILSKLFGIENTPALRTVLMGFLGMFVAFPLGLLRNIDSLTGLCAISMSFYAIFVVKMFIVALPNLWAGAWYNHVDFWNPGAIFQCLPIFSLAFACQTQLFVIYDALPDPSLHKMSTVVSGAVTVCGLVYLLVGFFGYVAFYETGPAGDVLLAFEPSFFNEILKLCFVLSVAISFPLVIFPCRASLHSLLFSQPGGAHGNIGGHSAIPPTRFKLITFCLVSVTLVIGINIPDVEFVLGLTGATMGTMICFIFPAVVYLQVVGQSGNKAIAARVVLITGLIILVASTYSTLMSHDKAVAEQSIADINKPVVDVKDVPVQPMEEIVNDVENVVESVKQKPPDEKEVEKVKEAPQLQKPAKPGDEKGKVAAPVETDEAEKRQEPPNPQAPVDNPEEDKKEDEKVEVAKKDVDPPDIKAPPSKSKRDTEAEGDKVEVKKLIQELKETKEEQQKILKEQKEIVAELKEHQKEAHPDQVEGKKQAILQEKHKEIQQDLSNLLEKIQDIKKIDDGKDDSAKRGADGGGQKDQAGNLGNNQQQDGDMHKRSVVEQPGNVQAPAGGQKQNVAQPDANLQQNVQPVAADQQQNVQPVANAQQANVPPAGGQQPVAQNAAGLQQNAQPAANLQQQGNAPDANLNVQNVQQPVAQQQQQQQAANVPQQNVGNAQQGVVANGKQGAQGVQQAGNLNAEIAQQQGRAAGNAQNNQGGGGQAVNEAAGNVQQQQQPAQQQQQPAQQNLNIQQKVEDIANANPKVAKAPVAKKKKKHLLDDAKKLDVHLET